MADFLFTDLEGDVRLTLQDVDETQWTDAEVNNAINEARRYVLDEICRNGLFNTIMEQNSMVELAHGNFSYKNEIDLPTDFYQRIRLKEVGDESSIAFVSLDRQDDSGAENRAFVRTSKVGSPVPGGSNTGTDTLETYGDHTGTADAVYTITIEAGGATFKWRKGAGSWTTGVACATSWTTIEAGIKVRFGAATGFTANDTWTFTAYASYNNILRLNFDPTTDLELWYVRDVQPVALSSTYISTTARLEFRRYYDPLKLYVEIKLRNRNEENISQDMAIYAPVSRMIMDKAAQVGDEDQPILTTRYKSEDLI